jgi:hypothetical protein
MLLRARIPRRAPSATRTDVLTLDDKSLIPAKAILESRVVPGGSRAKWLLDPLPFTRVHNGAGGKESLKFMWTKTCSNAAVRGARSSSGNGSKNIRRTKAT